MSDSEKSAMDALVDEAMEGRDAKEAAEAAVDSQDVDDVDVVESDDVDSDIDSDLDLGFAPEVDGEANEDVQALIAERDSYLADSQRLAADFANFRKQSEKRVSDAAAAQSAGLVRDLIPVLDACDSALIQDVDSAAGPIRSALIGELEKNGLELLAPGEGELFDPECHEAVMHEPGGDDDAEGPVVAEVLRAGYLWKGKVVRPAMVKVVG